MKFLRILTLSMAGLLAACANPDRVVFVTSTNIGVGADLAEGKGYVGYDRSELFVGPSYTTKGATPPVVASMQSDLDIIEPATRQTYATGNAALIATGRLKLSELHGCSKQEISDIMRNPVRRCACNLGCKANDRRIAVVGTNTHVGLSVRAKDAAIAAVEFGYGRQEASVLPLNRDTNGMDIYPSTLAYITTDVDVEGKGVGKGTGLKLSQFLATGGAADALADKQGVKDAFAIIAAKGAAENAKTVAETVGEGLTPQEEHGLALAAEQRHTVWRSNADKLFSELGLAGVSDSARIPDPAYAKLQDALRLSQIETGTARFLTSASSVGQLRTRLLDNPGILRILNAQFGAQ